MDTTRIFAYGSLLKETSLRKTVPDAQDIYPARVFGFRRVFSLASHYRFCEITGKPVCVLNVERREPESAMNGICFEMDRGSIEALVSREQIYSMHPVTVHDYHGVRPAQTAFLFWASDYEPYCYLAESQAQRHYLDVCLRGCEVFGAKFLEDFRSSTVFPAIDSAEEVVKIWLGEF
jgi:cation transport regulator ChaC